METASQASPADSTPAVVIKRDGRQLRFDPQRIVRALEQAFLRDEAGNYWQAGQTTLTPQHKLQVAQLAEEVIQGLGLGHGGGTIRAELIQVVVERVLMERAAHRVARGYLLYRARRAGQLATAPAAAPAAALSRGDLVQQLHPMLQELPGVDPGKVAEVALQSLPATPGGDGLAALLAGARALLHLDTDYASLAARLLLASMQREVLGQIPAPAQLAAVYAGQFRDYLRRGLTEGWLTGRLGAFDGAALANQLVPERDATLGYHALAHLQQQVLLRREGRLVELPQMLFMRVAMGLALCEAQPLVRSVAFYTVLSTRRFLPHEAVLRGIGTPRPTLAASHSGQVADTLDAIFDAAKQYTVLNQACGSVMYDWSAVRGAGSVIAGTAPVARGPVPYLQLASAAAQVAAQVTPQRGLLCAGLACWHLDLPTLLALCDSQPAHLLCSVWVPDLFMQRVLADAEWTLLSPHAVPGLLQSSGAEFARLYQGYEARAQQGEGGPNQRLPARVLWSQIVTTAARGGALAISFQEPCSARGQQQHHALVRSVDPVSGASLAPAPGGAMLPCHGGAVNLAAHLSQGKLEEHSLLDTIGLAMRMLDNCIEWPACSGGKADSAAMALRPVALGMMGFQELLWAKGVPYDSAEAVEEADRVAELFCYEAQYASTELAEERGAYPGWAGQRFCSSVPLDALRALAARRPHGGLDADQASHTACSYGALRQRLHQYGLRNVACLAQGAVVELAVLAGVTPAMAPAASLLQSASDGSGADPAPLPALVAALRAAGGWDSSLAAQLQRAGSLPGSARIAPALRRLYRVAREIEPRWQLEIVARCQKWMDMAYAAPLQLGSVSAEELEELAGLAWLRGLSCVRFSVTPAATPVACGRAQDGECEACT